MQLEFLPFTDQRFSATADSWNADAAAGLAFPSEIQRLLEWVGTHRQPTENDSAAFGVFPKGKPTALGICEVIVQRKTQRAKWVKMLRLHLKPSVDDQLQKGIPETAMDVFVHSITGSMDLQMAHDASTLKVYGRTNEQLAFLKALVTQLKQHFDGKPELSVKATIEGRFLSITV